MGTSDLDWRRVAARSWLYVPGGDERKLEKVSGAGADVVILDLEDAVAANAKDQARVLAADFLAQSSRGTTVVRVQAPSEGDGWRRDLDAVVPGEPDALIVPKVESIADVDRVAAVTDHRVPIVALIEVPAAFVHLAEVAASPDVVGLALGAEDLSRSLGGRPRPALRRTGNGPIDHARFELLFAARAAGCLAIESPFVDFGDDEGLARQVEMSCSWGFDGMQAIHPKQVGVIHNVMRPTEEELAWATAVVEALSGGASAVATVDGAMIDRAHLPMAERILALMN